MTNTVLCGSISYEHTVKENEDNTVSRLGFNPTSKGRKSKIELKKTA